ncbi:MAG: methionyl-tRNA formyltransferase, partial [Chitinophagia bacterium]|nr:methionyl-tRNA formyltransferase [Chitinophagia bacterium]
MAALQDLKIVFYGTPAFAVASLDDMLQAGAQVVAVVTAPDKPAGRGKQLQHSAVKEYALAHNLPLLQPVKMRDPEFLAALRELAPDLQVVVAFR